MNLEILLSCMHQNNLDIIKKSKIESDVLIINQTDYENDETYYFNNSKGNAFKVKIISTKERGLSKSRNMALMQASGDICLIADDDEHFVNDYQHIIEKAYKLLPDADIIAFALDRKGFKYPTKIYRVGYLKALKISSIQISFKRQRIIDKGINFDETMGSGTGKGGGEENKFLHDCLKNGLKVYYYPDIIASVDQSASTWFFGFDKKYFFNLGWSNKKIMGYFWGVVFVIRFSIFKYSHYKNEIGFVKALYYGLKGVFAKR